MTTKILFDQRWTHRERQKDTYIHCPAKFNKLTTLKTVNHKDNIKVRSGKLRKILSKLVIQYIPAINFSFVKISKQFNYIYSWGKIPLRGDYFIEIDNPYCLTYYNNLAFKLYKPFIRYKLLQENCKKIVAISNTVKEHLIFEFGPSLRKKISVLYPYMEEQKSRRKKYNKVRLLFVGLDFERKGGKELLEAMKILGDEYHLTIIGCTPKTDLDNVSVLGKIPRSEIYEKHYSDSDIFVFPTFHESLGVVALEALSFGLPIITTNSYALPEIIIHKKTGYIINHPYERIEKIGKIEIINNIQKSISAYNLFLSKQKQNFDFVNEIAHSIKEISNNLVTYNNNVRKDFKKRFDAPVWKETFRKIIEDKNSMVSK
jgi:glycosyltransferase involved in cell wall biosynthesis